MNVPLTSDCSGTCILGSVTKLVGCLAVTDCGQMCKGKGFTTSVPQNGYNTCPTGSTNVPDPSCAGPTFLGNSFYTGACCCQ